VLVVATGVAGLIRGDHICDGAVVLDVGINPVTDEATGEVHMVGDVDFTTIADKVRAFTVLSIRRRQWLPCDGI
jgi:methylenetetrahydrofolate dehydrogenase (NADP+)/methenyltetrahydrofolate cyclohydrolase